MMIPIFAAISENDRRLILALVIVVFLVIVLLGYIGMWIRNVMRWQGKRMDTLVHDAVVTKVITDKEHLNRYGRQKNWAYFFKQSWIPMLLMIVAVLILIIYDAAIEDWSYNPFNVETGFGSICFLWDFSDDSIYSTWFGLRIISSWPPLSHSPEFVLAALPSYFMIPIFFTGAVWYLVSVQCWVSRIWRLRHLCNSIFDKSLENYNADTGLNNGLGGSINNPTITAENVDVIKNTQEGDASTNERPPIGGD